VTNVETPDQLLRRFYDEEFGFLPTNRSMKPVHVANGLARRLTGKVADHTPLARVLRQFVKNQKGGYVEERDSNEDILEDFGDRFIDSYGNVPSDEALTRFRSLAKETLGADAAVFHDQASFTLSHERMISADPSDQGSGDFLAGLLRAGGDSHPADAAELFVRLLTTENDPWTLTAWPMLDEAKQRDASSGAAVEARSQRLDQLLSTDAAGRLTSPTLRKLRDRYDQLARYEDVRGSKLTALRRLVLFGTFAIHVHMIQRAGEVLPEGPRPIILLDLFDGRRRSLREASAATLQSGFRAVEQLVLYRTEKHLSEAYGDAGGLLGHTFPDGSEFLDAVPYFDTNLAQNFPNQAWAESFWRAGYTGVGTKSAKGFPWHALLGLGRRTGYLLPYDDRGRGGKEHKRYGATAEFAEILVAATVSPGEPVDFDTFLDILRDNFGIVVGRPADFEIIRHNDLRVDRDLARSVSVNETDLRNNLLEFRQLITDIGFAKSYADGRTIVTTNEGRR